MNTLLHGHALLGALTPSPTDSAAPEMDAAVAAAIATLHAMLLGIIVWALVCAWRRW